MKDLLVQFAVLVIVVVNSLYVTYIVYDISMLYAINIMHFKYYQFYGAVAVLNIVSAKRKNKEESTPEEQIKMVFAIDIALAVFWGMVYVMHIILT